MGKESKSVLLEAHDLVYGQREIDYGHPLDNCNAIAALWNAYLDAVGDRPLDAADAAVMMMLMKVARLASGTRKRDTIVDAAGYAALIARATGIDS